MKAFANLDKEGQIKRSRRCAVGCVVIALLIVGLMIYGNAVISRKEAMCTSTAVGTVYSSHSGSRYSRSRVSAKFTVNGELYYTKGSGFYNRFTESDNQILVYYCPENPSISYTGKGMVRPHVVWYAVAAIFVSGCPLFLKQARMIEKNGRIKMNEGKWSYEQQN